MDDTQQAAWRVLLVDDDEDDYILAKSMLGEAQGRRIALDWASNYRTGQQKLGTGSYDAVLVDYDLGPRTGIELIREYFAQGFPAPFILFTDRGSYAVDVEAMQAGATLYLTKSEATPLLLERSLRYAIERKRIEKELDLRLQERTHILESISDAFYSLDQNYCFTYVNQKAASLWGLNQADLLGKNIWEVFPSGKQTESFRMMQQAMEQQRHLQYESFSSFLDTWVVVNIYPTVNGFSVYFQDITSRKQAEESLLKANALLQEQAEELEVQAEELRAQTEALVAANEKLCQNQELLRAVADNIPDAIFAKDAQGRLLMANPATLKVLGKPAEQALGKTDLENYADPAVGRAIQKNDLRVMESGKTETMEEIGLSPQGYQVYLSTKAPWFDAQGRVIGLVGIARNITDFRQAENALKESQADLNRAQAVSHTGSWRLDVRKNELIGSDETYRIFGIPPGTPLTYQVFLASLHPDDRDSVDREWQAALRGEPYDIEHRILVEGSVKWVRERAELEFDGQGNLWGCFGTVHDITPRKQAEAVLRESEERFRQLADTMPQLVWTANANGIVDYYNRRSVEFSGISQDVEGIWQWAPVLHPEDVERTVDAWQQAIETGAGYEIEHRVRRADGSFRWYLSRGVPVRDADGRIVKWYGTATDIHDLKQLQAALVESEERFRSYAGQLKRSNEALEDFAFIASHDLREPLRKVQSFGELLLDRSSQLLDETGRDYLERMQSAAGRMESMLDGLLAYSRVASQGNAFVPVELGNIAADVLLDLEIRISQAGGRVEIGDLPVIEADPMQMNQLLQNLLSNALKFHGPGVPPLVRVYSPPGQQGPFVDILIEDNGIGFDGDCVDQLFKPFHRLHGKYAYEGSGMGLAICRKIVERHGGSISARSEPGKGATFRVRLPRKQGE